jgi:hypothetical protein
LSKSTPHREEGRHETRNHRRDCPFLLTSTTAATEAPVPWQIEAVVADQAEG